MMIESKQFRDSEGDTKEDTLQGFEEAFYYHTVFDAQELIKMVGLRGFLESLYAQEKGRALTLEEQEAMQVLHENWEL